MSVANPTRSSEKEVHNRLEHFPISFFSIVMGLSGMTLAWKAVTHLADIPDYIWLSMGTLATVVMVMVLVTYTNKARIYPQAVWHEMCHPIRLNFFPTISISMILLGTLWQGMGDFAFIFWWTGAALQLGFTLFVLNAWLHRNTLKVGHANPGWFIPVVGNIIVPIAGVSYGYVETSWFFFSLGMLFWLPLLTIILYRLFFHGPLPEKLMPTWFILLAPPSIGFVSYISLNGGIDSFARGLIYSAVFIGLLLFTNGLRFLRLPYFISSWAFSFPLAALTVACAKYALITGLTAFVLLTFVLLVTLTLAVIVLIIRTLIAIKRRQICVPE
ncbi:SLAC1 anion channel family protein [Sansalvadorimonas sp. 2012CJ34-2]|uniref:SLAC1 anion channel family protein n=1 Tax=Parendozoicomonas callyspongiae TaxID=2942213 RepID=A0ABT0PDW8_9GAMM|nr:SLAC1 anion channel family protein [Sansalvadorimonas sp. 2012CJ34-2]MCL6269568.1 SLAC1 anion channel family protein [Sansalvadorimonas sp. 2012CJ34-2]